MFADQDKITRKIVDALAIKLNVDEQIQMARKDTDDIAAYDLFLKGWEHYLRWTSEDFLKPFHFFKKPCKSIRIIGGPMRRLQPRNGRVQNIVLD
ncbi:hypothetical protein D1BOALGB6SA_1612 [Olavius sp. associated proteobacterium Delta 1]|nr:hypothetical protein D1BOALGB6SA_1612 [Olavius sp. associated proteobacterium Delta 1]